MEDRRVETILLLEKVVVLYSVLTGSGGCRNVREGLARQEGIFSRSSFENACEKKISGWHTVCSYHAERVYFQPPRLGERPRQGGGHLFQVTFEKGCKFRLEMVILERKDCRNSACCKSPSLAAETSREAPPGRGASFRGAL